MLIFLHIVFNWTLFFWENSFVYSFSTSTCLLSFFPSEVNFTFSLQVTVACIVVPLLITREGVLTLQEGEVKSLERFKFDSLPTNLNYITKKVIEDYLINNKMK